MTNDAVPPRRSQAASELPGVRRPFDTERVGIRLSALFVLCALPE